MTEDEIEKTLFEDEKTSFEEAKNIGFINSVDKAMYPILKSLMNPTSERQQFIRLTEANREFEYKVIDNDIDGVKKLLATNFINIDKSVEKFTLVSEDKYRTALMVFAMRGNVEMVELCIKHGADLDIKDWEDQTALMLAVRNGHFEVAKLLVDKQLKLFETMEQQND